MADSKKHGFAPNYFYITEFNQMCIRRFDTTIADYLHSGKERQIEILQALDDYDLISDFAKAQTINAALVVASINAQDLFTV